MKFFALVVAIAFVAIVESKPQAQSVINRVTLSAGNVADIKIGIENVAGPLKQLQTVLEGAADSAPVFKGISNNIKELIGEIQIVVGSIPSSSLPAKDLKNIVNDLQSKINGLVAQVDSNWDLLPSDATKIAVTNAKVNINGAFKSVSGALTGLILSAAMG